MRWPMIRQSKAGSGIWEDCLFHLNEPLAQADAWMVVEDLARTETCQVPDGRVVLLMCEWHYLKPTYAEGFLRQFDSVHTYRPDRLHPKTVHRWLPLPWFHGVPMISGHSPAQGAKTLEAYLHTPAWKKNNILS